MTQKQHRIYNFVGWAITIPIVLVTLFLVGSMIPQLGYKIAMVKSGSMEPTIKTGGLVVYGQSNEYSLGDVVSFNQKTGDGNIVTIHRIVDKETSEDGQVSYVTRGDNNPDEDPETITQADIVGKVWGSLPVGGYAVNWLQTKPGVGFAAAIPLLMIVYHEIHSFMTKKKDQSKKTASPQKELAVDDNE